jgi:modulator of FtsH protease HflK
MNTLERWQRGQFKPREVLIAIGIVLGIPIVLGGIFSTYYTVRPEEEAVVLRFGRYVSTSPPGLHFRLPFGIDRVVKVPVTEVRNEEFGFRTTAVGRRSVREALEAESLMLTGDLNIADVEWVVQYRIKDARQWIFSVREQEETIRDLSESVIRTVVGDHTVTEVLTGQRESIAQLSRASLQERLDYYEMGVQIVTVKLQNALPPAPVRNSFNDVNAAEQERDQAQNEAQKEYSKVVELARGEAKRQVSEAEGYQADRVNRAQGDIARFVQLLAAYNDAKVVTRRRLYLETMERILPQVERILVVSDEGVLKMLPLATGGSR